MKGKKLDLGSGGYDPAHFDSLVSAEDRHFWFRARNQVISLFAAEAVAHLSPGYRVLEMGCGDGNVLRFLERACSAGTVVGMDLYGEGIHYARSRTACPLVQGDVRKSPFGKTFQVIGIFDVLEHIPDDSRILLDLWKLLENGGTLLLTVPANPSLWSYFDELAGHCRRYEAGDLRSKLEEAGFAIEYLTPYMASLSPLMWLSRGFRAKTAANADAKELLEQELRVVPVLNEILDWALSWETRWLARRRQLPFGSSLLAVARKQAPA
jgi:2-polyprenyl-3-methyl-5-hydroxy-6-metoxy-1,4-benzoquinol methylase